MVYPELAGTPTMNDNLLDRITLDPERMAGKPVIRGTRLTVEFILNLMAHGAAMDDILEEYPGLVREDIQACLLYAAQALEGASVMPLVARAA
jgi:uncharacterized protein (DUF433 family)